MPGFAIARFPVTLEEYIEFLNELAVKEGIEAAKAHSPHDHASMAYFLPIKDDRFLIPEVDSDGIRWLSSWPVFGITLNDAQAYCRWYQQKTGIAARLPTEIEWEKAARGGDRRKFPWGDRFDATFCKMIRSRPGMPQPEPVGSFPTDESPYGVFDMAGCISEWTQTPFDEGENTFVVKGGCWSGDDQKCRISSRYAVGPKQVHTSLGFRLVRDLA